MIGERGVSKCISVGGLYSIVWLLWPIITGLAGAIGWFGHVIVVWVAGLALASVLLTYLLTLEEEIHSGVVSGKGAGAAHSDDDAVVVDGRGRYDGDDAGGSWVVDDGSTGDES